MWEKRKKGFISGVVLSWCSGCGKCVDGCGHGVLEMKHDGNDRYASIGHQERCSGCGKCADMCRRGAVIISDNKVSGPKKEVYESIMSAFFAAL